MRAFGSLMYDGESSPTDSESPICTTEVHDVWGGRSVVLGSGSCDSVASPSSAARSTVVVAAPPARGVVTRGVVARVVVGAGRATTGARVVVGATVTTGAWVIGVVLAVVGVGAAVTGGAGGAVAGAGSGSGAEAALTTGGSVAGGVAADVVVAGPRPTVTAANAAMVPAHTRVRARSCRAMAPKGTDRDASGPVKRDG